MGTRIPTNALDTMQWYANSSQPSSCWVKWNHAQDQSRTGPINEDEEMNSLANNQTPEAEASDKSASTVTEAVCTTENCKGRKL